MASDADLTRRMAATLALLLVVDLCFVAGLAVLLSPWLAPVQRTVTAALPFAGAAATLAWWALLGATALLLFVWAQLRYARRRTLANVDARPVTRETHPDLVDRVHRLAQLADVAPPTVAVSPSSTPNSFAVGTLGDATVVVSDGLLATLDDAELDAVLAHELAHVANRDATVMTLASFLPALTNGEYAPLADLSGGSRGARIGLLAAVAVLAALLSAAVLDAPVASLAFVAAFIFVAALTLVLGGVLLGVLTAPVVFLGRSLSRQREFAADAAAADLTGDPAALADALVQLDEDAAAAPATDKRRAYDGLRGLCFLPHGFDGTDEDRSRFRVETRSHPPTDERIARIRDGASPG